MSRNWSSRRQPASTLNMKDAEYSSEIYLRLLHDAMRSRKEFEEPEIEPRSRHAFIEVDSVDFFVLDNAKSHHTEKYDLLKGKDASAVFRRGESFTMSIRFKRPFNAGKDNVKIVLIFGPRPDFIEGTSVTLKIPSEKKFTKDSSWWDIAMSRNENTTLTLKIQIPFSAFIGVWTMKIESGDTKPIVFECKESIYILFNPWSKDDPVYMEEQKMREEYVLDDFGKIFMGTYNNPRSKPWEFAQFDDVVLPASVYLLDNSRLDYTSRSNPIHVVRAISAMINANDEGGVLIGNWSGKYEGGTDPTAWTGSLKILEQYMKSGGKSVKYGQCWVFSGICTSVCRALGIPCRSVTNFVSCHDKNENISLDIYLDENGNKIQGMNKDSTWNYHVWNDCWMARYDLPKGYGGWQAVDATPQETSEGIFRSGPASLVAIKRGEINHRYDTRFVFAEVNSDVFHWQKDNSDFGFKKLYTNTYHIGRLIATKKPKFDDDNGISDLDDISIYYKPKEGSAMERMAVLNAARRIGMAHIYEMPHPEKEDVYFKLKETEEVMIGKDFHVVAEVENRSEEQRTVTSAIAVSTVYYTGVIAQKVKKNRGTFILKPKEKEEFGIHVTAEQYFDKLVQHAMLKIYAISNVKETKQTWVEEDDFQLQKPHLNIEIEGEVKLHKRFTIKFSFTNPLKRTLHDCGMSIEGSGLMKPLRVEIDDVGSEQTMTHTEHCTPKKTGDRRITAVFFSRELNDVVGSKHVTVEE